MIETLDSAVRFVIAMLLAGIWQAPLFALAAWLVLRIKSSANATTRHSVLAAALFASLTLPAMTATLAMQSDAQPPADTRDIEIPRSAMPYRPSTTSPSIPTTTRIPAGGSTSTLSVPSIARLNLVLPRVVALAVVGLWLAGAAFVLVRLIVSLVHLERLKRDALPLSIDYRERLTRWAGATKGARNVRLCTSDEIDIPIAVGLFDAMILVPKHLLDELLPQEIDAIVLHELAHLRRSDDWFNAVERFANAILFFNPAILWLASQLDLEREVACDDWVLQQNDALPYATCLAKVAETAVWPHRPMTAPGAFVTRRGMSIRIERLLANHRDVRIRTSFGPAGSAVGMLAALGIVAVLVSPSIAYPEANDATVAQTSPAPLVSIAPLPVYIFKMPTEAPTHVVVRADVAVSPHKAVAPHVAAAPHVVPSAPLAPKPLKAVAKAGPPSDADADSQSDASADSESDAGDRDSTVTIPPAGSMQHLIAQADDRAFAAAKRYGSHSPVIVAEANTPDYIDELASVGYTHLSVDDLVRLKSVGVDADFIRSLERNGMTHPSVEQLVQMRAIGVDPKYVAEMRTRYGNSLSIGDISSMRAVGVTNEYASELAAAGLTHLSAEDLRELRALDVQPSYVRGLLKAGMTNLSAGEIASVKAVGVDPDYVAQMRKQFGPSLDLGQLSGMHAVGVTPDYVAQLYAAGLTGITPDRITGLRALGITPGYLRSLARAGYNNLTTDQVQQLRALDIDGDFIDRANAHGFHHLSVDQLIHLKATGVL